MRNRFLKAVGLAGQDEACVPHGVRVYAVGDIHGCADLLDLLHEKIVSDASQHQGTKRIVYLGDFVDRGSDSKGVIERMLKGVPTGFLASWIKGNHDAAVLNFLEDPETYRIWRGFGAPETLMSYGVRPPLFDSVDKMIEARDALRAAMPDQHLAFFRSLPLKVEIGDYLFVHAGVRPGVSLERQSEEDLLWIRDEFLGSRAHFGKVVVHGHTPMSRPERTRNRISVDTGAYASGVLSCAVLEGRTCRFLQANAY